jgi:hypothetical protein
MVSDEELAIIDKALALRGLVLDRANTKRLRGRLARIWRSERMTRARHLRPVTSKPG